MWCFNEIINLIWLSNPQITICKVTQCVSIHPFKSLFLLMSKWTADWPLDFMLGSHPLDSLSLSLSLSLFLSLSFSLSLSLSLSLSSFILTVRIPYLSFLSSPHFTLDHLSIDKLLIQGPPIPFYQTKPLTFGGWSNPGSICLSNSLFLRQSLDRTFGFSLNCGSSGLSRVPSLSFLNLNYPVGFQNSRLLPPSRSSKNFSATRRALTSPPETHLFPNPRENDEESEEKCWKGNVNENILNILDGRCPIDVRVKDGSSIVTEGIKESPVTWMTCHDSVLSTTSGQQERWWW